MRRVASVLGVGVVTLGLSACGGGGKPTGYGEFAADLASLRRAQPCPQVGDTLPPDLEWCKSSSGTIAVVPRLTYDNGCVIMVLPDSRWGRPGEPVADRWGEDDTVNPCT